MKLTNDFQKDLFGGLTAAVTALPLAIAFGVLALSDLGPEYASMGALAGLYGAIFTGIFASLFGGTPSQITGPTGPMTTVVTGLVAALVARGLEPSKVLTLTFLCVLLGGLIQVGLGLLRVGGLIKYIPYPVVAGFMNGIAVIIFMGQVRPFLGLEKGAPFQLDGVQPLTVGVGVVTILAVVLTPKLTKKVPGSLAGLGVGTLCYYLLARSEGALGPVIGEIPSGVPTPSRVLDFLQLARSGELWPELSLLIPSALALGVLGAIDSLLTSVVADTVTRTRHNSNQELVGQGIGNIISGCFGGLAGAGATVRTLVNVDAGGRGKLSGIIHGLILLLVLLVLGSLAGKIPYVVLAGILLVTAVGMFDRWSKRLVFKLTGTAEMKKEIALNLGVVLLVTLVTVLVDLMVAVGIGIVVACFLFVAKMSTSVVRRCSDSSELHSRRVHPPRTMELLAERGKSVLVFQLQGALFFGTADQLTTQVTDRVDESIQRVLFDMSAVREIDASGARVLLLLEELLEDQGKQIAVAGMDETHLGWKFLIDMGVVEAIGQEHFFPDLDRALDWSDQLLLADSDADDRDFEERKLEELDLLSDLSEEEAKTFTQFCERRDYEAGDVVVRRGEAGDSLFILVAGSFVIKKDQRRLAAYGPGSVIGEMGVLEQLDRTADVEAERRGAAYEITRAKLEQLLERHPSLGSKFLWNLGAELSARLRWAAREIACLED